MKESAKYLIKCIEYSLIILLVLWVIQVINYLMGGALTTFGILPRSKMGLIGIITAPLIHGGFDHLIANSVPLFILSILLFFFYKKRSLLIFCLIWITAGFLTWLIGRYAWHIGASIMVYALASFLFFGGIFSKKFLLIIVSVFIAVTYYGLLAGIVPSAGPVSWEGHLAGFISGFLWAYIFRGSLQETT